MKAGVSHPTKEQWAEIAKRLDNLFEKVYLRCDGFLVEAEMNRLGKNSLVIAVFVNGRMHAPGWVTAGENVTRRCVGSGGAGRGLSFPLACGRSG